MSEGGVPVAIRGDPNIRGREARKACGQRGATNGEGGKGPNLSAWLDHLREYASAFLFTPCKTKRIDVLQQGRAKRTSRVSLQSHTGSGGIMQRMKEVQRRIPPPFTKVRGDRIEHPQRGLSPGRRVGEEKVARGSYLQHGHVDGCRLGRSIMCLLG